MPSPFRAHPCACTVAAQHIHRAALLCGQHDARQQMKSLPSWRCPASSLPACRRGAPAGAPTLVWAACQLFAGRDPHPLHFPTPPCWVLRAAGQLPAGRACGAAGQRRASQRARRARLGRSCRGGGTTRHPAGGTGGEPVQGEPRRRAMIRPGPGPAPGPTAALHALTAVVPCRARPRASSQPPACRPPCPAGRVRIPRRAAAGPWPCRTLAGWTSSLRLLMSWRRTRRAALRSSWAAGSNQRRYARAAVRQPPAALPLCVQSRPHRSGACGTAWPDGLVGCRRGGGARLWDACAQRAWWLRLARVRRLSHFVRRALPPGHPGCAARRRASSASSAPVARQTAAPLLRRGDASPPPPPPPHMPAAAAAPCPCPGSSSHHQRRACIRAWSGGASPGRQPACGIGGGSRHHASSAGLLVS